MPRDVILVGLAVIAGFTDWRWRKIFNWTTFPAIILGVGLNFIFYRWSGLKQALVSGGIVFLLVLPLVYFDIFGPGDGKFLVAVATLRGWEFSVYCFLYGAIVAGMVMMVVLLIQKKLFLVFKNIKQIFLGLIFLRQPLKVQSALPSVPFGFFLSVGVVIRLAEVYFLGGK